MGVGVFINKEHQPTSDEVFAAIGSKRSLWENLTQFILNNYHIQGDFTFYGKNYGWALRFRKGGKALLSIYPTNESFTVQIVLGKKDTQKASNLQLDKNVKDVLEKSHEFPEGRWLFIEMESEQDINDIKQLLITKSPQVKK